ncbi:MAG TPA: hypothetical protein PK347_03510 [Burkholderiaceae bacterium]|nr:hypothetical protein [Burkholderiaceae bacterium]
MNCLADAPAPKPAEPTGASPPVVLAADAGVPFEPQVASGADADPIAQWLGLMEVVQMLCPVWPVRTQPTRGNCWRL